MEWQWDRCDRDTWRGFLDLAGTAPLPQSWEYGAAMQTLGARVRRAVLRADGQMLAVAQVLQRPGLRQISRGPVWLPQLDAALQRRALRGLARFAGVLVATPEDPVPGFGLAPLRAPRSHALWSLDADEAGLLAGLQGKWRNRLRRAQAPGVSASPVPLMQIVAAEGWQRRERGYRGLPASFIVAWPGEKLIVHWSDADGLQAGMVFLRHGCWASYHIGWASDAGRAAFAHGPMLWQAALLLRQQGVRMLDLGDVDSDAAPGLARFKLGTGARRHQLGAPTWVLPDTGLGLRRWVRQDGGATGRQPWQGYPPRR